MRNDIPKAIRLLAALALCFTGVLAQNAPLQQVQPSRIPSSISNQDFWSIIAQFSEPGGVFSSDNYTSNELMIGQVASDIIARGKTGGAYLGVGPEQNFTYIAAIKPEIVLIVDIRRQAVMQHLMYKAIFEMSANRSEFIARLFSKPLQQLGPQDTLIRAIWEKYVPVAADSVLYQNNIAAIHNHLANTRAFPLSSADSASIALVYDTFYRYGPMISYSARAGTFPGGAFSTTGATFLSLTLVTDTTGVPRSFLATDANYQFIRGLHSKNLFIPVVGDFGGPQALRKVGDYLREHRAIVSAYYTSNVEQYLFRPLATGLMAWQEYYKSVGFMPLDSNSVFIRPNGLRVNAAQVLSLVQGLAQPASNQLQPSPAGVRYGVQVIMAPPVPPTPPIPPTPGSMIVACRDCITGSVTDSASSRPVASVSVQVMGTTWGATTDSTGRFTIPNVPPGIYTVEIRRIGYSTITAADVRMVAGGYTTLSVQTAATALILTQRTTISIRNPLSGTVTGMAVGSGGAAVGMVIGGGAGVTLCPIIEYLTAFKAGRVAGYADATACVR